MPVITVFSKNISLYALWELVYFIFARKQVCPFLTVPYIGPQAYLFFMIVPQTDSCESNVMLTLHFEEANLEKI